MGKQGSTKKGGKAKEDGEEKQTKVSYSTAELFIHRMNFGLSSRERAL